MPNKLKRSIAKLLLVIAGMTLTRLPYTNFTSRLIDRLIVASEG